MTNQAALAEFARRVITEGCWEGTDIDGGTLQDWAEELGLIYADVATEADKDQFTDLDVGDKLYRFQPWLAAPELGEDISVELLREAGPPNPPTESLPPIDKTLHTEELIAELQKPAMRIKEIGDSG